MTPTIVRAKNDFECPACETLVQKKEIFYLKPNGARCRECHEFEEEERLRDFDDQNKSG